MRWSFCLGRVHGVPIEVHGLFLPLLVWSALQNWDHAQSPLYLNLTTAFNNVLILVLMFACILLHEIAHTVQAQALGIPVRRITLLPFGGLAELARLPEHPLDELRIAGVGPLANLALGLLFGSLGGLFLVSGPLSWREVVDYWSYHEYGLLPSGLMYLAVVNVSLGLFNLIPTFPMDGGRVLRSVLALVLPRLLATRIVSALGWLCGITVTGFGFVMILWMDAGAGLGVLFVGLLALFGAGFELTLEKSRAALGRVVASAVVRQPTWTTTPTDAITPKLAATFRLQAALPVVVGARVVGLLVRQDVLSALDQAAIQPHLAPATVAHIMRTHFPYVRADESLWRAHQILSDTDMGAVPVLEGDTLQGMLTSADVSAARYFVPPKPIAEHPIYLPGGTSPL